MVFDGSKENPLKGLGAILTTSIDVILPPHILLTGQLAGDEEVVKLWAELSFLDEPCCYHCGFPFEFDEGEAALCIRCSIKAPPYECARSGFIYDDKSRRLVLAFKHGGRSEGLGVFSQQMKRAGRRFLEQADYLVPVPLHFNRRVSRRYNQAALLARALAKITSPVFDPDILMRSQPTPSQGGLSAAARRKNVRSVFKIRENARTRIKGSNIIIIDDVMTTGATVESCARTLQRAGAGRVDVITLSRVVKAATMPT